MDHVVGWIETYCSHPLGDLAGEPLVIPDWFKNDFIAPLFGWKKPDGYRRYQEAYLEVGSGNAKSTLNMGVALYCLCADGQFSPRVYCVAGSKDQARIIFNGCRIMVQNNPDLSSALKIYQNSITIQSDKGLGTLSVISADGDLQQGLNPTAIFFDELHVQPNDYLYNSLKKNFPKRKEPLLVSMTTAGVLYTFAAEMHDKAVAVRDGVYKADGFFPLIYAADLEGDDFDEAQWRKANPGWDYLNIDLLREEAEGAKKSASALAAFRRYHLNKWSGAQVTWLTDDQWMQGTACKGRTEHELKAYRREHLSVEALRGRKCYLTFDLSNNRDTTAAIFLFPPESENERIKVYKRVYIPYATLADRAMNEATAYLQWVDDGDITVIEGERIDKEFVGDDLIRHIKEFDLICVGYDAWNADEIVRKFEREGIECIAYSQGAKHMSVPMKALDNYLSEGRIEHGGDPVLRWMCSNTQAKKSTIGGSDYMMPTKSSERSRIDGIVALIMAIGIMIWKMREAEELEKSLVKTQGIVSIKLKR